MTDSKPTTQQENNTSPPPPRNQPVHRIRVSGVQAAIWQNRGNLGTWYNVTLSRSYKDADDEWKSADSFSVNDLLLVAKVADEARSWIMQKQQEEARN